MKEKNYDTHFFKNFSAANPSAYGWKLKVSVDMACSKSAFFFKSFGTKPLSGAYFATI